MSTEDCTGQKSSGPTVEELRDDLPWDPARLPLDPRQRASDAALAVLDDIAGDRVTVERVQAVCRGDQPPGHAEGSDWTATLQHADGELVAVSWSTDGISNVVADGDGFRNVGFSALAEIMGDDPEIDERLSGKQARQLLDSDPMLVTPSEVEFLEDN